jgi:hypothetical protein
MDELFNGLVKKKDFAALAINRCIYELIDMCHAGNDIKNRCQIGVYGYGSGAAKLLIGGPVLELNEKADPPDPDVDPNLPVWVKPRAEGCTPMCDAFKLAADLITGSWLPKWGSSFPPVVINITDGEPTDNEGKRTDFENTKAAADALVKLRSSDGNVLLFNAHIAGGNQAEVRLPASMPESTPDCAKFLFSISSELPPQLLARAKYVGFSPSPGARGCVYNAGAETLTRLIEFGSLKNQLNR